MPGSMEEALFLLSVSRLGSLALLLGHLPALLPGHRLALLPGHIGALLLRHVVAVLLGHVVALLVADHCAGLAGNRLALLARHLGCELGQIRSIREHMSKIVITVAFCLMIICSVKLSPVWAQHCTS